MAPIETLLHEALERTPLGDAHALWADTLLSLHPPTAIHALERWLPSARGVARCELLCALARAHTATGLAADALLDEATALAEREWSDAERAWSAVAATHLAVGALDAALDAWTHEENPYRFDCRTAFSDTAAALCRAGRWDGLEQLLRHVGPGHDQAVILHAAIDDALDHQQLTTALQALWWIPEGLREDALLHAIQGALRRGRPEDAWAVEALWDGIEDGVASRARALALLGDAPGARALLSPLLVAWLSPARPPDDHDARHAVSALAVLGDTEGAVWCLGRIPAQRPVLRALREAAASVDDPTPLVVAVRERWPEAPAVLRVVGSLEVAAGALAQGRARLRLAADHAAALEDFYARRLGLQEVAHAQIAAGDIDGALESAERLSRQRFGHEHVASAAVRLAAAGAVDRAAELLGRLPPGPLRIRAACAVLVGGDKERVLND